MTYGVERKQYKLLTIKIATEKQRSLREEKEKLTSNRLSNCSRNLVTLNMLSKSIYKKIKLVGFKYKGWQLNVLMGRKAVFFYKDMISQRERERENDWLLNWKQFGFNGKVNNSINISCLFDEKMMSWERENGID